MISKGPVGYMFYIQGHENPYSGIYRGELAPSAFHTAGVVVFEQHSL